MKYKGIIIEESLLDKTILTEVDIVSTEVVPVTVKSKTPHLKQWTLHSVEIPKDQALEIARRLSQLLDKEHNNWYADYKTEEDHFIIFSDKIFHITDRTDKKQYDKASQYGISIGIPDYQVDFSEAVKSRYNNF